MIYNLDVAAYLRSSREQRQCFSVFSCIINKSTAVKLQFLLTAEENGKKIMEFAIKGLTAHSVNGKLEQIIIII